MENTIGVYIGRFSPMHLGHQAVIDAMIEELGVENCVIFVGSANTPQSMRHLFTYQQRRHLIKLQYPMLRVLPLPDFNDNDDWFYTMNDLLELVGTSAMEAHYYAGCKEDVGVLSQYTENITIVNRFDGTTPKISATEIRDTLISGRPLDGLLHPSLTDKVQEVFRDVWKDFKAK